MNKNFLTRIISFVLAAMMILTSLPINTFAEAGEPNTGNTEKKTMNYDNTPIGKEQINGGLEVNVAKLKEGEKAAEFIAEPKKPDLHTVRVDYKVKRGDDLVINYQPYIATVGAAATEEEQAKVKKIIDLPKFDGYTSATPAKKYNVNYNFVNGAYGDAKFKTHEEKKHDNYGIEYKSNAEYIYNPDKNKIKVRHIFQHLFNREKYGYNKGEEANLSEEEKKALAKEKDANALKEDIITEQDGLTGTSMKVQALQGDKIEGYEPEVNAIQTQVPENVENFELIFRYNRKKYSLIYDSKDGTPIPSRTIYYQQIIPKLEVVEVPKKVGGVFQGWKPSTDLYDRNGKKYEKDKIIRDSKGNALVDIYNHVFQRDADNKLVLDKKKEPKVIKSQDEAIELIMPASNVTFTAEWKDKEKADYAIQFWAEKADHADDASLMDKYDYMGTRVYKDKKTGSRPNLDAEPVKDIVFPDLDQARLNKIWAGAKFNRGRNLYLNKFFVYNKELTDSQNGDKTVSATGQTVYNIYYDRQVYDLYFTKSNAQPEKNTIYPEIWGYDKKKGEAVMKGGPGNPYHYKARFNEMMYKWPNDAKQTKGFTPGYQSFGWGPNYTTPNWPLHLDTPPYRLNADEFLDMANYTSWGGYKKKIDKGDGTTIDLDRFDFTTLSFGIKQDTPSIPHHMDFWMDGFKDGETIIRYDLVRTKADTSALNYGHRYPIVLGFTPYDYDPMKAWPTIEEGSEENGRVNEDEIGELNDERDEITPNNSGTYYNNNGIRLPIGQLDFISHFFSDDDGYDDVKEGGQTFDENGYLRFRYKRNKYKLRLNNDPAKAKDDSAYDAADVKDVFYEYPLKDLNLDLSKKPKRPDWVSKQAEFKGWATDPAGIKLVRDNKETMPYHDSVLFAQWGEPDYKWKVKFDPNGGVLSDIDADKVTVKKKTIIEGDVGEEKIGSYPKKEANDGNAQVFTVIQRQKLVDIAKPWRKGYDFMGWEYVRYKKNKDGNDTTEVDTDYFDKYGVPELYTFGNDVVSNLHLKAIWVKNDLIDIKSYHHFLDKEYQEDEVEVQTLEKRRINSFLGAVGSRQNTERLLVPKEEFDKLEANPIYQEYIKLKDASDKFRSNTYNQYIRVKREEVLNEKGELVVDEEAKKYNEFHFFYRPFRKREYTVKYVDERYKGKEEDPKGAIIADEEVVNGNRDYDARNFRSIPGWKLVSDPQQQLVFDVGEDNEFLGINGTGKNYITFYYKDVRVIEVPNKDDPIPEGYVRVTFKAEKGGSFGKDKDGKDIKELHYDVIKGLISDKLPVPQLLKEGESAVKDKYYITPDNGKKFVKWDNKVLLNKNTVIEENHTFTAYFDWSGLSASGLVRTEAYKDDKANNNKDWTNDFAPKIADLKKQLVWKEKDVEKDLPKGTTIQFFDEKGNELKTDEDVYNLVKEKKAADKDELVRTVNVKAKVTFKDGKEPQELDIPIKVYKNVYEALTTGDKPLFLKEAEEGELKDITGEYVKVTVNPTKGPENKDSKVYYVNKKAWVDIDEVNINKDKDELGFTHWSASIAAQNDGKKKDGVFDFNKRHMFTEGTVITPGFSKDVIPQEGDKKPEGILDDYVKVTFVPTEKATDETKAKKVFWVNPAKKVTIPVTNPIGKDYYTFKEWKMGADADGAVYNPNTPTQFTAAEGTTITATYDEAKNVIPYNPKEPITRPDGYIRITFQAEEGITLKESKAYYVKKNAKDDKGVPLTLASEEFEKPTYEEELGYEFTNWDPADTTQIAETDIVVTAKSKKLEDKIEKKDGVKPPKGYVEVKFVAGENGKIQENDKDIKEKVYYVNPKKYVTLDAPKPVANTGYSFGGWTKDASVPTVYTDKITTITANFNDLKDVVPKTKADDSEKPAGYNTVTFVIDPAKGGKIADGETKVFFVNPAKEVTLDPPATKADTGYEFDKWNKDASKATKYTEDTTIKGKFNTLDGIIPKGEGANEKAKPEGYVTVKFVKGQHGTEITGETVYYVNPKANVTLKTLGDKSIDKPTVKEETGWTFNNWDKEDTTAIDTDITVTALYSPLPDVDTKEHPGYITVKFSTEENGFIKGSTTEKEKTVYVNPYKAVALDKLAPDVEPNTGFEFVGWDTQIEREINYKNGDVIRAKYNEIGDVIPKTKDDDSQKKSGYVKVTFDKGAHGTLSGTTVYFVNPNKVVTVPAPQVTAAVGYKQKLGDEAWDQALVQKFENDTTITAQYTELDPIITGDQAKPEGYKTVTFKADGNGTVSGTLVYYVNPKLEVDLSTHANKSITKTAKTGYTAEGGTWTNKDNFALKAKFSKDTEFIYNFQKIKDIIDVDENTVRPEGYVLVTFKADENGKLEGDKKEIKYYVNPKAGIKLVKLEDGKEASKKELAVPKTIPNANNVFYTWYEDIDTNNEIVSDRTYVAKFITSQVELSYKANGATSGDVPENVKVPYGTKVRLASAPTLERKNYKFQGWKIGNKTYKVGDEFKLTANTEAIAQWKLDDYIIPYDPQDPKGRPDDSYVRISFESDEGIELSNVKYYYVKKGVDINLNDYGIVRPTINLKTGYEKIGWDKTGLIPVGDKDVVIKATSKPLDKVIPAKDANGNPQDKPEGYVEVKFVAGDHGSIQEKNKDIQEKLYYVNPNLYVQLTAPSTEGDVGYTFASWDKDASIAKQYKENTTITASFNQIGDVIPKTKDNDSEKPEGYATVKFVIDPAEGGKILDKETTVYYVDPNRAVTINPPLKKADVGYEFDNWDIDTVNKAKKYTGETTVKGSFKKLEVVVDGSKAQPEGYVKLVFDKGEDGKSLEGQTLYYVNPKANVKLSDINKPKVTAKTGYKFTGWDTDDTTVINDYYMVIAQYEKLDDVIPKTKDNDSEKPEGYITVKFLTTNNGTVKGTDKREKVLFVNPNKAVVLEGYAPDVTADNLHTFAGWDTSIHRAIQYNDDDKITALYNDKDNIYEKAKAGYVKVVFSAGENGEINKNEKTEYWVKPGVTVTVPAPKVEPNIGYEFTDWDKTRTVYLHAGDLGYQITALYNPVADVIPGDLNKPDRYKTVTFKAENGSLSGTKVYYVNPNAEVDLTNEAEALVKNPDLGYTVEGAKWDKDITKKKYEEDETYTFKFEELPAVDTVAHPGYVKVEFIAGDNGSLVGGDKTYYVNPTKNVTVGSELLPIPETAPHQNYVFDKWILSLEKGEVIKSDRKFVALFKAEQVTLTYDINKGKGTTPSSVTMPYGTKINLASARGITREYYSFKGWKIDGKLYQAGDEYILDGNYTAVAEWEEEQNIIPYDPENPITKPVGYVRVKFEAEEGLELVNPQYCYVRKGIGVKLGNNSIVKPDVQAKTGYKFIAWDKDDNLVINEDIVVTAKSKKLDDVIGSEKGEKPEGYVRVKFIAGDNGTVNEKTYYVNPYKYVTLTPPTATGNTGYEFGSWSKDATVPTVYEEDLTTIVAQFNEIKAVIPKTRDDDSEKPEGYKTVTFVIDPEESGSIAANETIVYYVDPKREVTINPPTTVADTGYEFDTWDQDTTKAKKYADDTIIKGKFKSIEDIIPSVNYNTGKDNPKPDGYVTVTYLPGDNGKLEGETVYYVNPKADPAKTLSDKTIVKPEVKAELGYKFTKWDTDDTKEIKENIVVKALYEAIDDVIEKTTNDESEKPVGYITVVFKTTDKGGNVEKTVYINPNKAVVLKDKAPDFTPIAGYTFARWDKSIDQAIQYKDGDVITALYNKLDDILESEAPGYVEVEFNPGEHGTLTGTSTGTISYWIKPDTEVDLKAPEVEAKLGYKFDAWDKSLRVKANLRDGKLVITAKYKEEATIVPESEGIRPEGYVEVVFKAVNGSIKGNTRYYVNPKKLADFNDIVDGFDMSPDFAFTAAGATWNSTEFKKEFKDGKTTFIYTFKPLATVIPAKDNVKKPDGYVKVTLIPTDKATDETKTVYYVNPTKEVNLGNETPTGRVWTDLEGVQYTYIFKGWTVTRGTVATWNDNIEGKFIQDTEITATYETKTDTSKVPNKPEAKDDVVTGLGDTPEAKDLIKNVPGTEDKPLPDGTKFRYADGGEPDTSNPGDTEAKVVVRYPDGKEVIVTVPITVVDNVVPQTGEDKPNVPEKYIMVTVDTTDKATDNTKFKKVFWVKPGVKVTLEGILAPTGKQFTEDGVTHDNKFLRWESDTSTHIYTDEIKDTFTKDTIITAVYEYEKNIEPVGNNNQIIPKGSSPDAKDFINNPYNDKDPKNKDNLPPGTSFEFVPGFEPDTETPGTNKTTKIKVTYPNGEVKEVPVTYNVTEDVVEQTDQNKKPDVPDYFVEVVVDTTDFAKGNSYYVKTYWVNPEKTVEIPASIPEEIKEGYAFDYWQVDLGNENGTRYRQKIEDRFVRPTYIKACYYKVEIPEPGSDYVVTDVNVFPNEDEYRSKITPPKGKEIARVIIIAQPDVSRPGNRTQAEIEVFYTDGTSATVKVKVYVQRPGETNTRIIYRDKIVEKEKIVEKIIKIKDNQRLKEVRFMQGFEGKFRPHDGLTRAEAAQILANALKQDGYKYNPAYPINYKDVKQKWYTQAIVITTQANVFKGYDDGYFRPEEKISRAEWIATLKRFQQLKDADGNKMGLKANHWATREVEAAYEEGWLQIYTNGNAKFNANEPITREEVAAVTNKAFGRLIDRTYIMRNDKSVINYKDINPSMWSYVDILCASNSFIHDENVYMSHGIEYIKTIVNNIEGTIIFNVQLKNLEIIQDKFQRYLR